MTSDFRILGPLEVTTAGVPVTVAGPRQQRMLLTLLLHAGRPVPAARLVDSLWPAAPPATARAQIRNTVAALRRMLAADGLLCRYGGGYALRIDPAAVDRTRFERLVAEARAAISRPEHAVAGFHRAEALWRGPAMVEVAEADQPEGTWAGGMLRAEAFRLEELRLQAIEERIDLEISLGAHARVVPELVALTREHPGREGLHAALMTALHRCDRSADAMAAFDAARAGLRHDFGLEPGYRLQRLRRDILDGHASHQGSARPRGR